MAVPSTPRLGPAGTGTPGLGSTLLFHDATLGGRAKGVRGGAQRQERRAEQTKGWAGRREGPAEEGGAERNRGSRSSYGPKKAPGFLKSPALTLSRSGGRDGR